MLTRQMMISRVWILLLLTGMCGLTAGADGGLEFDFDGLSEGKIDGQAGWKVYDKVRNSSAFSVAAGVGITEAAADKALVVKRADDTIRCVTEDYVNWSREETARVEFDFRLAVPAEPAEENWPVMVFLLGNSILGENARWEVRLTASTDGDYILSAALPDEASAVIPAEKMVAVTGDATLISDWMRCVVKVEKKPAADAFQASVEIMDKSGQSLAVLNCTDSTKSLTTRAMWNLSRLHAGFLASRDIHGLACIDRLVLTTGH